MLSQRFTTDLQCGCFNCGRVQSLVFPLVGTTEPKSAGIADPKSFTKCLEVLPELCCSCTCSTSPVLTSTQQLKTEQEVVCAKEFAVIGSP